MPTNYLTFEQRGTISGMVNLNGFAGSIDLDAITNKFNEHAPIPNPNIPIVAQALNLPKIAGTLENSTFTKMTDGMFPVFFDAVQQQSHIQANQIVDLWELSGKFTEAELVQIRKLTAPTEPDPYAPATVPSASIWEAQFLSRYPSFSAAIDGVVVTACHKVLVSEATGITIQ